MTNAATIIRPSVLAALADEDGAEPFDAFSPEFNEEIGLPACAGKENPADEDHLWDDLPGAWMQCEGCGRMEREQY